ncbi:type VI secretion system tube protein TssD [Apibacter muscae]|uniref:type VI secretion system tube protein TssD n=1 Tax=Apibacter muscae TaxID=2509004 RepID=UPI00288BEE5E|nr:type VI secretion system tube protein TssD [Apibacter muscae]
MYHILECEYEFEKRTDAHLKPTGETEGGKILITLESTGKTNFIEWAIAPNKEKSGEIIFYRRDAMSRLLTLKFERAYCIHFKEKFTSNGGEPMVTTLTLVARKLKFSNLSFVNNWSLK